MIFLLLIFLIAAACLDQRENENWPFQKTYNFSDIVIPGQNDYVLTKLSRSSFKINITFYGNLPEYRLRVYMIRDIDWLKYYQTEGVCLNNPNTGTKIENLNKEKWCCVTEIEKNQKYECFFKKWFDYREWLNSKEGGYSVVWDFNRVSYKDELIDFDVAVSEINKFMNTENNDDDMKTNYVMNLRSADLISRLIVLDNPEMSTYRIDNIVIVENEDLERDNTQRIISRYIVTKDMVLLYVGILLFIIIVIALLIVIIACFIPSGIRNSKRIIELFKEDRKLFSKNLFVTFLYHFKDSMDEVLVVWECCSLCRKRNEKDFILKIEEQGEETGFKDQVEKDRENRVVFATPGALIAIILTMVLAYFIGNGIEALGNHIITPNNPCSIAELCCPGLGSESEYNTEELVIQPQVEGDEGPVIWKVGEACYWKSPYVTIGELENDILESRYEKCYYSQYSYPICKISPFPIDKNDSREICDPNTYDQKPVPLWVQAPKKACKTLDLTSNSIVNQIFMKIVYTVLSLIIVKPIFLPISGFFKFLSMGCNRGVVKISKSYKKNGKKDGLKEYFKGEFEEFREWCRKDWWNVVKFIIKLVLTLIMSCVSVTLLVLFIYFVVFGVYHQVEVSAWNIIFGFLSAFFISLISSLFQSLICYAVKFRWRKIVPKEEKEEPSCCKCKKNNKVENKSTFIKKDSQNGKTEAEKDQSLDDLQPLAVKDKEMDDFKDIEKKIVKIGTGEIKEQKNPETENLEVEN